MGKELLNTFDKELLLKDLCGRLPYGVKVRYSSYEKFITCTLHSINPTYNTVDLWSEKACFTSVNISKIKPYLFPMSSMTEEQRKELDELGLGFYVTCQDIDDDGYIWDEKVFSMIPCTETDDWINANHFDYRGLIEKGLAIDCTNLNIY